VQLHTFKGISSIQVKCSHSKGDVNLTSSNQNANKDIHVWGGVNIFRLIRGEKLCFWKNPQENIIVITKNISVTHVPKRHVKLGISQQSLDNKCTSTQWNKIQQLKENEQQLG
jgi:hypothetical protein